MDARQELIQKIAGIREKVALELSDEFILTNKEKRQLRKKGFKQRAMKQFEQRETKNLSNRRFNKSPVKRVASIECPEKQKETTTELKVKIASIREKIASRFTDRNSPSFTEEPVDERLDPKTKKPKASFTLLEKGEFAIGKKYKTKA